MTVYVLSCDVSNITPEGVCTVPVWIEKPQPAFPPLTFEDGALISFAIVGVWTLGLAARLIIRAGQAGTNQY